MSTVLERPVSTDTVSIATPEPLLTAEEFWLLPGIDRAELANGKVVQKMPPAEEHGSLAVYLASALILWARENKAGRVYVETGFRMKPNLVRAPDVSFLETARVPHGEARRKFVEGPPTLAIEIVSPNDAWSEVEDKVNEYLEAGARAVWIVEPDGQTLTVRTVDAAPLVLRRGDVLRATETLPGFELSLDELFADD